MRKETVEIYSDKSNLAVICHPDRKIPGVLIQGDVLYSLCREADEVCTKAKASLDAETYSNLNELRNGLWARLNHYKDVLGEHGIALPFSET